MGCPAKDRSDVGNFLAQDPSCQFAAMWRYHFPKDEWYVSLRGRNSCNINLSQLTEKYFLQGGGHALAAGFMIDGKRGENLSTYFHLSPNNRPYISNTVFSLPSVIPENVREIIESIENRERDSIVRQAVLCKMAIYGKTQFVKLAPRPLDKEKIIAKCLFDNDEDECDYVGFWEYKIGEWTVSLYHYKGKEEHFSIFDKDSDKLSSYFEAL